MNFMGNQLHQRYIDKSAYVTKHGLDQKVRWVESYFERLYETELKDQFKTKLRCYEECLLFFTVMFHQRTVSLDNSSLGVRSIGRKADPITEFERFHYSALKSVIGSNIGRKKHLQPKLFGWIDFAGTRNGHGSTEQKNPHLHGVALVPPQVRYRYEMELRSPIRWVRSGTIQDVKVVQYNAQKGSLPKLIGYCVKGLEDVTQEQAQWLEVILPPGA